MEGRISLTEVRQKMVSKKLGIYIQPRSDMYGGEEVPIYEERLKFETSYVFVQQLAVMKNSSETE